jgi:hypothetical protein
MVFDQGLRQGEASGDLLDATARHHHVQDRIALVSGK